ncbi:MAG: agmatinase [bacterium]|nr:agmatinase [bacterium]
MNKEFFLPSNFGSLPIENSEFETSKVIVIPVPYDSTTSFKAGTREGPQAIISASKNFELYDIELEKEIYKEVGIHTLGELEPVLSGPEAMIERVYEVGQELIRLGKFLVMLGGEHSLSSGIVRALKEKYPALSVLQLDAHADLRDEYLGSKYNHAAVMRRIYELCPITQVGIRSMSQEEAEFIKENNLKPFYARQIINQPAWIDEVLSNLGDEIYITIDLDVLDPSIMPAVGTPEPGGLGWYPLLELLAKVSTQKRIVGFDVVELAPSDAHCAASCLAATLVYKLIGYVTRQKVKV